MKTEWKKCKLGEICLINTASYSTSDNYSFINYLDTGSITQNKIEKIQKINLSIEKLPSRAKRRVKYNSIIYSTVRPNQRHYGIIKNHPENFIVSTGFAVIDVDTEKANPDFIYYILIQDEIINSLQAVAEQSVSTYPSIKPSDIEKLDIFLPPLPVQKKIAGILKSLDDKIELNRQINKNLEEQARSLFNEQFDKANDLLPDGWQIADIYSIANVIYGAPFASNLFNTEGNGKPIIRIRDLQSQNFTTYTTENHPKGYLLQRGDIVVGMDGEFRPYIWGNDEAWLNQRICVFENKRPKGKFFLYFTLLPLLNFIEETEMATTVIHIGKKDFDAFRIILPDEKTLNKYDELTMPMFEQIVANKKEITKLAQIRDTILPKLMCGEIEV